MKPVDPEMANFVHHSTTNPHDIEHFRSAAEEVVRRIERKAGFADVVEQGFLGSLKLFLAVPGHVRGVQDLSVGAHEGDDAQSLVAEHVGGDVAVDVLSRQCRHELDGVVPPGPVFDQVVDADHVLLKRELRARRTLAAARSARMCRGVA